MAIMTPPDKQFDSTSTNSEIWRLNSSRFSVTLTTISDQRPQNMQIPIWITMCLT